MGRNEEVKEGKKFITKELMLGILKTGTILGLAVFAPGALKLFKNIVSYFPKDSEETRKALIDSYNSNKPVFISLKKDKSL